MKQRGYVNIPSDKIHGKYLKTRVSASSSRSLIVISTRPPRSTHYPVFQPRGLTAEGEGIESSVARFSFIVRYSAELQLSVRTMIRIIDN